jgi:nicotinic acid phosphoribosyltransferase
MSASADSRAPVRPSGRRADANDPGLLTPAQTSLLTDQYELAMASSYLGRGMNEPAVFELFVRHLPVRRRWLLAAGLGPALALVREMEFAKEELQYVRSLGFGRDFIEYLARFRFSGDVDAMPEGTVAFAGEPLMRVTAPRVEAQLLETLLSNQINFQLGALPSGLGGRGCAHHRVSRGNGKRPIVRY